MELCSIRPKQKLTSDGSTVRGLFSHRIFSPPFLFFSHSSLHLLSVQFLLLIGFMFSFFNFPLSLFHQYLTQTHRWQDCSIKKDFRSCSSLCCRCSSGWSESSRWQTSACCEGLCWIRKKRVACWDIRDGRINLLNESKLIQHLLFGSRFHTKHRSLGTGPALV